VFLLKGLEQGVGVYVIGRGIIPNGALDDDAAERLRANGATLVEHVWTEPEPSPTERLEIAAADKMLGRYPDGEGRSRIYRDLAAKMNQTLRPMRKSTLFGNSRRRW
jgi:hypothetical protein